MLRLFTLAALAVMAATAQAQQPGVPLDAAMEAPRLVDTEPQAEPPAPEGNGAQSVAYVETGVDVSGWLHQSQWIEPAVEYPTVAVTGFFQADGIWIAQDDVNLLVVGDAQDTADFRRARLAAKGNVAENVSYMIEFDFAFPGRPSFMDVYLDVADTPLGHFRAGQWRQPFGLEAMTSVRELIFLERALPFAMVPFRQMGIGIYDTAFDGFATWALSGYRFPTDAFGDVSGDSGYGMSTRATALLYEDARYNDTLHVGAGYTFNQPSTGFTRIRTSAEVGVNQLDFHNVDFPIPFFVDTGPLPADSYQVFGTELAASRGPLLFQSELHCSATEQIAAPAVRFWGGYAHASYVLTGERRTYNKQQGVYGRVAPRRDYGRCGPGAWEIAGRWSYIDLRDENIGGGKLHDLTFGLNWYLNRYAKFQFNYIHAMLERPAALDSTADILALRAQLDF